MEQPKVQDYEQLVSQVEVKSPNPRDPVEVSRHPEHWRCVGLGNSAAVFQPKERPDLAIKVYADAHVHVCAEEAGIYEQLGDSPYFPRFYGRGPNFLLIEYKQGRNVYDCLLQGVYIPEQVILDVDEAIAYAESRGLTPSDIHVKNVLVHEGRGYLVDVSDYRNQARVKRWGALKQAYYDYYVDLYRPGRTVPSWLLETIRKWYKSNEGNGSLTAFADRIKKMFF